MEGTSTFPPQSSHKPLLVFVLVGSVGVLGLQWRDFIGYYIDLLRDRINEGNPHRQTRIKIVEYCYGSSSYVAGGRDEITGLPLDDIITEDTLDLAAFHGYMSIIKMIDDLQNLNEDSYYLWHFAAGQHDDEYPRFDGLPFSWDPKWQDVRGKIMERNISLSMILANPCPNLLQLFYATPARMHIQPWFAAYPNHTILLSGFVEVTVPNSSSNSLAYGIQYGTDNQWGPSTSQLAGSDTYAEITATVQDLNLYEDLQVSSPIAMQALPYVPGAQVPTPMPDATEELANASAGPTTRRGNCDGGWTGRLYWNGVWIHAQAKADEAVRNPKLPEWPEDLQLEIVADSKLSTTDIQAWMRKTKASMAVLRCICKTEQFDFNQLVQTLSTNRSYAIVRWENRERLLLAPAGKALHCAAFPDKGIPERPKHRPPPPLCVTKKTPSVRKPNVSPKKKRSPPGPQPKPVAMPTSLEGSYPMAMQNGIAPLQPQSEQVQVGYPLPHAMGHTPPDGDPYPIRHGRQANTLMQHQAARMSPPQRFETPLYPQSVWADGATGVEGELHRWRADASAASRVAYSSDIDPGVRNTDTFGSNALLILENDPTANSEAFDMNEFVNLDNNGLGPETL